jgi:hypothetical protein
VRKILLASTMLLATAANARDIGTRPDDPCGRHPCHGWVRNHPPMAVTPARWVPPEPPITPPVPIVPAQVCGAYAWAQSVAACERNRPQTATAQVATVPTEMISVRPNSVVMWEAPRGFSHVFVSTSPDGTDKRPLIEASADQALGNRRLILSVGEPRENLFGRGEAIIARGNVLLYDDAGKEVARLVVEVTPLEAPARRVNVVGGGETRRLECTDADCGTAFKPRDPTAIETRPDGPVRREYAPTR